MKSGFCLVCLLALAGCDQLKERAGIVDPIKADAEGKALGSACRHAGWGPEDCYRLHPDASKSAMFTGWKDMNEYMMKNNMQAQPPTIPPEGLNPPQHVKKPKKKVIELDPIDKAKGADKGSETGGGEAGANNAHAAAKEESKAAGH